MAPPALHHSPQQQSASMDWEDMVLRKERAEQHQSSPVSAGYPISPVSTTQTHASYSYPPASSTSRQMTMAQVYMQPMPQSYPHSAHAADRQQQQQQQHQQQQQQQQQSDVYSDSFLDRRYSYSQPSYSSGGHDSSHMQHHHAQQQQHSPTTSVQQSTIPPHRGNTSLQQQQPISYAHRRSITEAQGYRPVVMNQPTPSLPQQQQQQQHVQQQHPHAVRIPTPSGMQRDVVAPMRAVYDIEPRVGRMS
ncbi:hypothetical protein EUX98_g4202 [Antrodiella citrinella]|uniref:Uncharacterized protein n=1 Tax=Antrodiella citrinella TaxID=2447956 RepID=A0A4S4N2M0_9APHY|nr:hypothetical protein EUX98_g4202 [Antrodiella citrinella]